jgi:peptide/nickel transport system permease protein
LDSTAILALSESRPQRFRVMRIFTANKAAVIGLALLIVLLLATLFAPLLTHYQPMRGSGQPLLHPSSGHLMGTDDLGRDVFTEVLYGERVSLIVGFLASAIAFVVGVIAGSVAGFFGGVIDNIVMRVTELFQVVPRIFLVIIMVALFGAHVEITAFAIGITSWPPSARILRAEFLSRRESEYVLAAQVIGASNWHVIVHEMLPNAISPMIVTATLNVATAILLEASLAFLGLSDPNVSSLGRMLQGSVQFLQVGWWMSIFPGLVVVLIIVSINLIGDGLIDILNPKLRQ